MCNSYYQVHLRAAWLVVIECGGFVFQQTVVATHVNKMEPVTMSRFGKLVSSKCIGNMIFSGTCVTEVSLFPWPTVVSIIRNSSFDGGGLVNSRNINMLKYLEYNKKVLI